MIEVKDIYSGKVKTGKFRVVQSSDVVDVAIFVTASVDGKTIKAITTDNKVFNITELEECI